MTWPSGLEAEPYEMALRRAKAEPEFFAALLDDLAGVLTGGDRAHLFRTREAVAQVLVRELSIQAFTMRRLEGLVQALKLSGSEVRAAKQWPGIDTEYLTFTCPQCGEKARVEGINETDGYESGPLGWARVTFGHGCPLGADGDEYLAALFDYLDVPARRGVDLELVRFRRMLDGGEVQWLIDGVMERGSLISLFGPPKSGKSLLALEWAVAVARRGLRVVYLDEENSPVEVDVRLEAMGVDLADLSTLAYHSFTGFAVDTEDGAAAILDTCGDADLVVFDSWGKFFAGGSQTDDGAVNRAYRLSVMPLRERGSGVMRLDHTGHAEATRPLGSSQKLADVDHNWLIRAARGERGEPVAVTLTHTENRTGRGEDLILLTRETVPLRHVARVEQEGEVETPGADPEKVRALVEVLDGLSIPVDWTVRDAASALRKVGSGSRIGLVSEAQRVRRRERLSD